MLKRREKAIRRYLHSEIHVFLIFDLLMGATRKHFKEN
jgi:hypothetical protein